MTGLSTSDTTNVAAAPMHGRSGARRHHPATAMPAASLLSVLMLSAALIPADALAQAQSSPPPQAALPNAQQLNPSQLTRPKPRQGDDVFSAPSPGPCPMASSALKFTLNSVKFTGADGVKNLDLAQAYRGMIGKTLSLQDVCDIRDRAADLLFRAGVLARVDIPEQTIANGELTLAVTTAHVVSVYVKGDGGEAKDKVADYIEKLRGMKPFDLRAAQRYLLLASDVPGVHVQATLRPSPGTEPGAVDFYVYVTYKPIDVTLAAQNTGSDALGPDSMLGRVDFNGLTPWGDKTSLILYTTTDLREQTVLQGLEEVRLGNDGWLARGTLSYGESKPGAALKQLGLEGKSLVGSIEADYPIIRARRKNLNLAIGFDAISQRLNVTGAILSDDKLRVLHAALSGNANWTPFGLDGPSASFNGGLEIRKGLSGLGASKVGSPYLSRFNGRPDATVERLNLRADVRSQPFVAGGPSAYVDVLGQFQSTDKVLLTYEDFVVGNLTIGRGYDPSALEGDKGYGVATEIGLGQFVLYRPKQGYGTAASVFAFYDVAHVESADRTQNVDPVTGKVNTSVDHTVHSTGGGIRLYFGRAYQLEVTYAHPQDKPNPIATAPKPDDRVLVSLTAHF